jgi:hypothetical protein
MEKKRGRPPKDPATNVSELVTFRLTPSEREQCERAAEQSELALREWLRDRVACAAAKELARRERSK